MPNSPRSASEQVRVPADSFGVESPVRLLIDLDSIFGLLVICEWRSRSPADGAAVEGHIVVRRQLLEYAREGLGDGFGAVRVQERDEREIANLHGTWLLGVLPAGVLVIDVDPLDLIFL